VAFGLADLSTHEELLERIVQKGGVKSLVTLIAKSSDPEAQRFAALALANCASAQFNKGPIKEVRKQSGSRMIMVKVVCTVQQGTHQGGEGRADDALISPLIRAVQ
jgi:hypothetical protein